MKEEQHQLLRCSSAASTYCRPLTEHRENVRGAVTPGIYHNIVMGINNQPTMNDERAQDLIYCKLNTLEAVSTIAAASSSSR